MKKLKSLLQSKIFIIISLFCLICYVFYNLKIVKYTSIWSEESSSIEGVIIDYKIDGDKLSLMLKNKEKIMVNYYFKTEKEKNDYCLELGDTIKIDGTLQRPLKNTIPNTFNYQKYLYGKKIYWVMNATKMEITKKSTSILYIIKNKLVRRVNAFKKPDYFYAFILGKNSYIDSNVYKVYQANGITHLFAVSGMHISFLIMIFDNILKKIGIKNKGIIIVFLIFYMFLIGFSASVVRASLFYIVLYFNKKSKLNINNLLVVYYLFFSLILLNPFYIEDLGFLYSFLTSFSLIIYSNKITGNYFKKLLKTSFIAFLASAPVTLMNFYEINLLTVFNNLIIVPFVSLILFPFTLLTFVFSFLEPALNLGFLVLEKLNFILNTLAINLVVPKGNLLFVIIYYFIFYCYYKYGYKMLYLLIAFIIWQKIVPLLDNSYHIYYLDVGQGDASFIVSPYQKDTIMIDTGGKIEYSKEDWQKKNANSDLADTLVQFFKSLGITKIDLLIVTHGDTDHIGYSKKLAEKLKFKSIMLNNNRLNQEEYKLSKKIDKHIKNNYLGKKIVIKNLNLRTSDDENESSLVLLVTFLNKNWLFMGDAPKSIEKIVEKKLPKVDVIKVGHHGSKTSTDNDFIKAIKPKYAIISAGRNNRYNHPAKETLKVLNANKIKVYNTQEKGTIHMIIKKTNEKFIFYEPL